MSLTLESAFAVGDHTPESTPGAIVTVVAGSSFVLCTPQGEITPGGSQGYFAGDTRLLNELSLRIAGQVPRLISSELDDREVRSLSTFGDPTRPRLLISRCMRVGDDLTLDVEIENLDTEPFASIVDLVLATDFADVFDVKRGVSPRAGFIGAGPIDGVLVLAYESSGFRRGLRATCDRQFEALRDGIHVAVAIAPHGRTTISFVLHPEATADTPLAASRFRPVDHARWEGKLPRFASSSPLLDATWERCCGDIASLLLAESETSDRPIVAAGSPWFMALFGRDSLITSWSALPLDHGLALGTLGALAARQGTAYVPESAEEPGRILHELRAGEVVLRPDGWGAVYYGSVDATPLFVMTLAELWRWGAPAELIAALLPAAERAVEWLLVDGDSDGDGFVEYGGKNRRGVAALSNQGWKDSDDAVRLPDGSIARGPIAMVEVQGYAHAAFLGLADLRDAFGTGDPEPLRRTAHELAAAIDEQFWLADEACYAMALDGDKRPVRSVSTNAGHLLWTGTARAERVPALVERLMADDMFTGYGLRTLSAENPGFNPLSYHCGSVWPHDSALVAAGMFRAGAHAEGGRLAAGLLDASTSFGGRPPELFGGFDRDRFLRPVPYPTSCSPQAWASGSTALLVRSMLGLRPDVPGGTVRLDPHLPEGLRIEMSEVDLGVGRLEFLVRGQDVEMARVTGPLRILTDPTSSH